MVDTPPRSQRKKNFPPRRASEQRKDVGAAPEPRVPYAQAAEPQPETVEFTAFEETEFEETETAVVPEIVVPEIVVPVIVVLKIAADAPQAAAEDGTDRMADDPLNAAKIASADASEQLQDVYGEFNAKATVAVRKRGKHIEEMNELTKGSVEVVADYAK